MRVRQNNRKTGKENFKKIWWYPEQFARPADYQVS